MGAPEPASDPAASRDLVRRGYDAVSLRYRSDGGEADDTSDEDVSRYAGWLDELMAVLPARPVVADLGCGNGLPAARLLVDRGASVIGIDFSAVQLARARQLVPGGTFVRADLASLQLRPASLDAAVSFYALIHVPRPDQRPFFQRLRGWLKPGGWFMATLGATAWTGVEDYLGAPMFWDHADTETYLEWLANERLEPVWHRFVPEGDAGHTLVLTRAV